jgi:hypothetical protein
VFARSFLALSAAFACAALLVAPAVAAQSDLDAFMQKVLASRDENWKKLQQYILDEKERIDVRGPANVPIWGDRREYSWFIRDGYFVRSPTKANGVEIPEPDRRKAEDDYLRRVKARDERAKKEGKDPTLPEAPPPSQQSSESLDALLRQTRQPGFIDSAYFLRFKFEQGKYALVGRETFDGREVLRIEYYPARLFTHEQDDEARRRREQRRDRNEDREATFERMMNKVSLVTLWVEPASHQIVKYTFDNVNLDFLPAAWLLRLTDLQATMTMTQPFPDVWLPKDVDMYFGALLAIGHITANYHIDYLEYRQAATAGRIIRIGGGR